MCGGGSFDYTPPSTPPPAPPEPGKGAKVVNRPKSQQDAQAKAARMGTSMYRIPQLNY